MKHICASTLASPWGYTPSRVWNDEAEKPPAVRREFWFVFQEQGPVVRWGPPLLPPVLDGVQVGGSWVTMCSTMEPIEPTAPKWRGHTLPGSPRTRSNQMSRLFPPSSHGAFVCTFWSSHSTADLDEGDRGSPFMSDFSSYIQFWCTGEEGSPGPGPLAGLWSRSSSS